MAEKILVINPGSASKKYALYEDGRELFYAHFETEAGKILLTTKTPAGEEKKNLEAGDFQLAIGHTLNLMTEKGIIAGKDDLSAIGVRVVAPGDFFLEHRPLDEKYLSKLREISLEAPLHILPTLKEIEAATSLFSDLPFFGISDSAFHRQMPAYARNYAIAGEDAARFDIYRFGYHGLSAQSVLRKLEENLGVMPARIIICHLGGGASVTAVKSGTSIENSMGFSPLEGLPMSTRVGNIDAGAIIHFAQKTGLTLVQLEDYFNHKSGLLGLSGKTGDVRELIKLEKDGDEKAALALNAFAYAVKKYIGSYFAVLGGLDILAFSGAIGDRSPIMRGRVCDNLGALGILLDEEKNNSTVEKMGFIHNSWSSVKIVVIPTDEMTEIAVEVDRFF